MSGVTLTVMVWTPLPAAARLKIELAIGVEKVAGTAGACPVAPSVCDGPAACNCWVPCSAGSAEAPPEMLATG